MLFVKTKVRRNLSLTVSVRQWQTNIIREDMTVFLQNICRFLLADVGFAWVETNIWKKDVLPLGGINTVGGAVAGGLVSSCCNFIMVHDRCLKSKTQEKKVEELEVECVSRHTPAERTTRDWWGDGRRNGS